MYISAQKVMLANHQPMACDGVNYQKIISARNNMKCPDLLTKVMFQTPTPMRWESRTNKIFRYELHEMCNSTQISQGYENLILRSGVVYGVNFQNIFFFARNQIKCLDLHASHVCQPSPIGLGVGMRSITQKHFTWMTWNIISTLHRKVMFPTPNPN